MTTSSNGGTNHLFCLASFAFSTASIFTANKRALRSGLQVFNHMRIPQVRSFFEALASVARDTSLTFGVLGGSDLLQYFDRQVASNGMANKAALQAALLNVASKAFLNASVVDTDEAAKDRRARGVMHVLCRNHFHLRKMARHLSTTRSISRYEMSTYSLLPMLRRLSRENMW